MFFSDIETVSGVYAQESMRYDVLPSSGTTYARILFEQASNSVDYIRTYNRIDDFLAYVGGLISSAIAVIFVMSFYSEFCYYISVANKLYVHDREKKIDSDGYHLLLFFGHCFAKIGRAFGCCKRGTIGEYADAEE